VIDGRAFVEQQIRFLLDKDPDALIDNQYNEHATLVTPNVVVRGRDDLKRYFHGYIEALGHLELVSMDKFVETGDTILFEATVRSQLGEARVYDALVLSEGKIDYHFAGVM
jgi:hypothetical protein